MISGAQDSVLTEGRYKMNSNDVNNIINNICEKLGTTASKLIPEMAGYNIAKSSIWLIISSIMLIASVLLIIKIVKMYKADGKEVVIFANQVKKLDSFYKDSAGTIPGYSAREWQRVIEAAYNCIGCRSYDADDYGVYIMGAVLTGVIGGVMFALALQNVIGWAMSPNAMAFMWVFNQLGGGQ